jgi:DNA-binding ferritin-like protein (Dps family)
MQAFTKNLLELWYELIGGDHHKDRDCHFYIEKNFSTYKKSEWRLLHYGYILGDVEECFNTYEEAEKELQNLLAEKIQEFCETETLDQRSEIENQVLAKLKKLLEGNDSPADEPSNSERR